MVNVTALLVPLEVVTVTLWGPVAALAAMAKVAVTEFAVEVAGVMVMPGMALMVAPDRLLPLRVMPKLALPVTPLVGLMEVSAGAGGLMVNVTALLAPLEVVTVTL